MARANELATQAANAVSQRVFAAVMEGGVNVALDRWLMTLAYGEKTMSPTVSRMGRDEYVLSPAKLTEELRTGELGGDLSNQELSAIAQAALERIAGRVGGVRKAA